MSDNAAAVQSRQLAASILDAVLHRGRSLKAELAQHLPALADGRDRALTEAIVLAALRQHGRYAQALSLWMARPPGARDGMVRALLYTGLAQLDAMQLPAHAALHATVEAARRLGRARQAGLVNAVLRRAQREGVPPLPHEAAWPAWLAASVRDAWGTKAEDVFAASAQPAPMWLRVNRARQTRTAYSHTLHAAGIAHSVPDFPPDAILLAEPCAVERLPGFAAGDVSVQDGSAQCLVEALPLAAGLRVLDACAAPGGKAAHMAERQPGLRLVAVDADARRVRRMQETFRRLGLAITSHVADARQLPDGGEFDLIVLDAPCSASGIVRRQPDILLHRRADDLAALVALQAQLLDALWPRLAPGGTLLYATCSLLPQENSSQIAAFLARTPDARLHPLDARFGDDTGHGHQRLPGDAHMDGFFYARLQRQ